MPWISAHDWEVDFRDQLKGELTRIRTTTALPGSLCHVLYAGARKCHHVDPKWWCHGYTTSDWYIGICETPEDQMTLLRSVNLLHSITAADLLPPSQESYQTVILPFLAAVAAFHACLERSTPGGPTFKR